MAFARLEYLYPQGLDQVKANVSLMPAPADENFELDYFCETTKVFHTSFRGLREVNRKEWREGDGDEKNVR